jgi:hypothetical protein
MDDPLILGTQENIRTSELIKLILNAAIRRPPLTNSWRLGITGLTELGQTATLHTPADDATILTGTHICTIAGDNWATDTSVRRALGDVTDVERGKCIELPDGNVTFWGRSYMFEDLPNAVDGTFTDAEENGIEYFYGDHVANRIKVVYRQREVDTKATVIAELPNDTALRSKTVSEIDLRSRNIAGATIGVQSIVQPVPNIDFFATQKGKDVTGQVRVKAKLAPGGVKWVVYNTVAKNFVLRAGSKQRGVRVVDHGRMAVFAEDTASIDANGVQPFDLNLPLLEDPDIAQTIADGVVYERANLGGVVQSVKFDANKSDALMKHAVHRAIGDRLAVSETQTGHSADYFIVGIKHLLNSFGNHVVSFLLEPAPPAIFLLGKTGFNELGTATVLGY